MLCYFLVIYGTDLYYFIIINKIDDAALDRVHVVQILIEAGANLNEGINKHCLALSLAVKEKNIPMIEALIKGGADPGLGDPAPFRIALGEKRSDIIEMLLETSAKPSGSRRSC